MSVPATPSSRGSSALGLSVQAVRDQPAHNLGPCIANRVTETSMSSALRVPPTLHPVFGNSGAFDELGVEGVYHERGIVAAETKMNGHTPLMSLTTGRFAHWVIRHHLCRWPKIHRAP